MILRITHARHLAPFVLELKFNDGATKRVDVRSLLHGPMFAPLRKPSYFRRGTLERECGTMCWPNGADLAPEALYELPDHADRDKKKRRKALVK
ncbi:MAG: DUF2442 domain-containing protein [Planctomycetes bacterium]|nr:DUF2442 domain-containing protein [Planctomycetota bacterium]